MKKIADIGSKSLVWSRPKVLQRSYELKAGDELVGSMRWENSPDHEAIGETGDGRWALGRKGFLRPRISAKPEGAKEPTAVLEMGWSADGSVKLSGGTELRWSAANFWRSRWSFSTPEGGALVTFHPDSGLLTAGARVEIDPAAAASREEVPLLVLLGWYVLVLVLEDSAIVGA